eukprot:SAG11_NODE_3514_length_2400_cov_1.671447_2_plen_79_part_00
MYRYWYPGTRVPGTCGTGFFFSVKKLEIASEERQDGVVADALMVRLPVDCRIIHKTLEKVAGTVRRSPDRVEDLSDIF